MDSSMRRRAGMGFLEGANHAEDNSGSRRRSRRGSRRNSRNGASSIEPGSNQMSNLDSNSVMITRKNSDYKGRRSGDISASLAGTVGTKAFEELARANVNNQVTFSDTEEDSDSSGDDQRDGEDNQASKLSKFPLLACGSNKRALFGQIEKSKMTNKYHDMFIPVASFDENFRVGAVSSGLTTCLVANQTTGHLYMCNQKETNGEFVKVNTKGTFVLDVATTNTTHFFLSGKRRLYSWGSEKYGQLGTGDHEGETKTSGSGKNEQGSKYTSPRNKSFDKHDGKKIPFAPIASFGSTRIKLIATGRFHAIVLTTGGIVYSWGRNNCGQLGHSDTENRSKPCSIDTLEGCKVSSVAAYADQSAAIGETLLGHHVGKLVNLKKKKVVAFTWGYAEESRLGHDRFDGESKISKMDDDEDYDNMNSRNKSIGFERRNRGGHKIRNNLNSIGEDEEKRNEDVQGQQIERKEEICICSTPRFVPGLLDIDKGPKKIAFGEAHGLCLTGTGQVYSWGNNIYGQLGLGHIYSEKCPTLIENVANIVSIEAGNRHSILISSQGIVLSAGFNAYGELGHGDVDMRISPTPVQLLVEENIKANGLCCGPETTFVWNRVASKDSARCFQEKLRQRQCRLTCVDEIPVTVERDAEGDGYSYFALAGPSITSGTYNWSVRIDKIKSMDFPLGIGIATLEDIDPYMFDVFEGSSSAWLYLSNGEKLHFGDMESYAEPFYEKDVIGVHLDCDLGTLKFSRRGKPLGLCYYLSVGKDPIYLCISLPGEDDKVTIIPEEEEDDDTLLTDTGLKVCYNEEGKYKTTGTEVFYRCGPCGLFICRACARNCQHRKHCTILEINHDPVHQHCECDATLCQSKKIATK